MLHTTRISCAAPVFLTVGAAPVPRRHTAHEPSGSIGSGFAPSARPRLPR